jgi:hypothetical protein
MNSFSESLFVVGESLRRWGNFFAEDQMEMCAVVGHLVSMAKVKGAFRNHPVANRPFALPAV